MELYEAARAERYPGVRFADAQDAAGRFVEASAEPDSKTQRLDALHGDPEDQRGTGDVQAALLLRGI